MHAPELSLKGGKKPMKHISYLPLKVKAEHRM